MKKRRHKLPSVSIVIPTFNEEKNIKTCLDSIFRQDYPKRLLEVLVVDNYSTDKTVKIAKKYKVKIMFNKIKDAQVSKMLAFKKSKGDLFYFMDADLEFKYTDYISGLVKPLLDDASIVGAFGRPVPSPTDTPLNRFLSYDPLQRDPVFEYFSPSIKSSVVVKRKGYFFCKFTLDRVPTAGRCLYWKKKLLKTPIAKAEKFMELDNLVILIKSGFTKFAYVPHAKEYHRHIQGIRSLIRKRLRNINKNYIPNLETRQYRWINFNNPSDLLKIMYWLVYAHVIIPSIIKGAYKTAKYRDWYCLVYEPVLAFLLTDVIMFGFLRGLVKRKLRFN